MLGTLSALPVDIFVLLLAALFAGMVDAVVGGGGLIQVPALFAARPDALPAMLFGTNKCASIFGTGAASWRYARRVALPWPVVAPAACAALLFAFAGAATVAWLPKEAIRPLILLLLVLVAVYTLLRKDFGTIHQPMPEAAHLRWRALAVGAVIGFYDGFFGPGTGSFLIFLFIRFFGFDFLHASAAAKVVNVTTNFAALLFFIPHGHWLPLLAAGMALANVAGSLLGTRLALRYGSAFIRRAFLLVVSVLIVRFAVDTLALF